MPEQAKHSRKWTGRDEERKCLRPPHEGHHTGNSVMNGLPRATIRLLIYSDTFQMYTIQSRKIKTK
jgi:hypothetical protein